MAPGIRFREVGVSFVALCIAGGEAAVERALPDLRGGLAIFDRALGEIGNGGK